MSDNPDEWLTLSQTAELLGVHPSTVRRWSDDGHLSVHRTEGKHRRYRRGEIELWAQTARQSNPVESENIIKHTLRHVRLQINEGLLEAEPWYQKLNEEARLEYRQSGRVLVQGLVKYISSDGKDASDEACALGYEYASRGRRCNLDFVEATRALLIFRNLLLEAIVGVYKESRVPSEAAWQEMLHKVHAFTDQIMLSQLETYQDFEKIHC